MRQASYKTPHGQIRNFSLSLLFHQQWEVWDHLWESDSQRTYPLCPARCSGDSSEQGHLVGSSLGAVASMDALLKGRSRLCDWWRPITNSCQLMTLSVSYIIPFRSQVRSTCFDLHSVPRQVNFHYNNTPWEILGPITITLSTRAIKVETIHQYD